MLFNSYEFIFFFLPVALFLYFLLNQKGFLNGAKFWLVIASLVFYSWWEIGYLPIILASIAANFSFGSLLSHLQESPANKGKARLLLLFGLALNLVMLGYFKYTNFMLSNINALFGAHLPFLKIVLPLGISFFTFTQTAYLVDAYQGKVKSMNLLNYALFVTFFPHLIAGPILHHQEMMPQFDDRQKKRINLACVAQGIFLFAIGLLKKVFIADNLAHWANAGFDAASLLGLLEAWATSLAYTFQLYFDFSGYTDMALGIALLFNISLPVNFNSPYQATDLQDFWRRWHITLSRFLRDYVYIPLGGNRSGEQRTYLNLLVTFLIGGLWHGAGWTFIFWGFLHGAGLVLQRLWQKLNLGLPKALAWFVTFNFVNVAWVFFRAKDWKNATDVLSGMVGLHGIMLPKALEPFLTALKPLTFGQAFAHLQNQDFIPLYLVAALILVTQLKNSNQMAAIFRPSRRLALILGLLTVFILYQLTQESQFLYFNF